MVYYTVNILTLEMKFVLAYLHFTYLKENIKHV